MRVSVHYRTDTRLHRRYARAVVLSHMDRGYSTQLGSFFKRVLRSGPLTVEERDQLSQLAEAIVEYGRMYQSYCDSTAQVVIMEAVELERRFRETPQVIEEALLLLSRTGRAEPADPAGCWKVKLGGIVSETGRD